MAMIKFMERVRNAEREVGRFREDWQVAYERMQGCWALEDIIDKANHLHGRILALDMTIQRLVAGAPDDYDPAVDSKLRDVLRQWFEVSRGMLGAVDDFERESGTLEGTGAFRENVKEAGAILTPDDAYFDSDALVELRDRAIDDHRAGLTEPLDGDGCDAA